MNKGSNDNILDITTINYPIYKHTWFRVGGHADICLWPKTITDLSNNLHKYRDNTQYTIISAGSNTLVRDGGIRGITICTQKMDSHISVKYDDNIGYISVSAFAMSSYVSLYAIQKELCGFEFLSGIPGMIGGGIKMNAGCYGREFKDIIHSVTVMDISGNIQELSREQLDFTYRQSNISDNQIIIATTLIGYKNDILQAKELRSEIKTMRKNTQPIHARTGGSTFKNPSDIKAWQLIDQSGCRGMQVGGAQISDQHCNFIIVNDTAIAHDVEQLGENVRNIVHQKTGYNLEWEIKLVGTY